jgi:hypothetical protein
MKKKLNIISALNYIFISKNIENDNLKKINKDVVKFNFKNLFKYKDIFIIKTKSYILIYNFNTKKISIPEGFILYKSIKKDGIYISKNPKSYYNILIIKNKNLIKDYAIERISNLEKKLLEFEHNLPIYEIDYESSLKKGINNLSLQDLIYFIQIKIINKTKLKIIFEKLVIPFLLSIITITIIAFAIEKSLEKKYKTKLTTFKKIKTSSYEISKKIQYIENIKNIYSKFNKKISINYINLINEIAELLPNGYRISYIKINNNIIIFTIDGKNSTILLEKLNKIKNIQNLKLISSIKLNNKINRFKFKGIIND